MVRPGLFASAILLIIAGSPSTHGAWTDHILGPHLAGLLSRDAQGVGRRLLQSSPWTPGIKPSPLAGYDYSFYVRGKGTYSIPQNKVVLHWANDPGTATLPAGVRFAVEVWPYVEDADDGNAGAVVAPGWAGLGWSEKARTKGSPPPQMINATAVIGYIDANNQPVVDTYDLRSKNVFDIIPGPRYTWTITDGSIEETASQHLILRFRRSFDALFTATTEQRMILAYCDTFHGLQRHNARSGLKITFSETPQAATVNTRLNPTYVQAHAWSMFVTWGVILPLGVIIARYFRDDYGRWYMVHLGLQSVGLLLLIAAITIPLAANRPYPRRMAHYQLGLAVFIMAMLQPFSAVPRFMTHHGYQVTSLLWAYLHWTMGRAALVFAFVNMFLGISRYRTWYTLGSWAEAVLGCYIGGLILVCLALEARLWRKSDLRNRGEWDEVSQRISSLESPARKRGGEDDDDDLLDQAPGARSHNSALSIRSKGSHDHV